MKILFISQIFPYPPINGGTIKTLSTLKLLKKINHQIYLCSFVISEEDLINKQFRKIGIANLLIDINYKLYQDLNKIKKLIIFLKSLFSQKPFSVYKYYNNSFKAKINKILISSKFDCIWIDHFNMAQYLPDNFTGLKILETHDVNSLLFREMFIKDSNIISKIFALTEWLKYSIYEKRLLQNFDKIYTISDFDKSQLIKLVREDRIQVLPLVMNVRKITKRKKKKTLLLFVGRLRWYPNKDGINYLIRKIFPLIRQKIPNIKLWIVGTYSGKISKNNINGVDYFGFQKDLSKFYKKANIFVTPLRYGTGIRIKILEAMAWGLPIVSTYQGARGLEVRDGKELLLARTDQEFADKVVLLLNSSKLRNILIKNAKKYLMNNFSQKKCLDILKRSLYG